MSGLRFKSEKKFEIRDFFTFKNRAEMNVEVNVIDRGDKVSI